MEGIDIADGSDEVLEVSLKDIFTTIRSYVAGWDWHILHLWGVGELPGRRTIGDYEELAGASPLRGARISEAEIRVLATHAEQIIDMVLVGNANACDVQKRSSDRDLYQENDLVIEANDSSYWRVVSQKPEIINALRKRFTDVRRRGGAGRGATSTRARGTACSPPAPRVMQRVCSARRTRTMSRAA